MNSTVTTNDKNNFDKSLFAFFLKQAVGDHTQSAFSKICHVRNGSISEFINERREMPPSDEFLLKVAKHAHPSVTVEDLFASAGKVYTPSLTLENAISERNKSTKVRTNPERDYIAPEDLPDIPDRKMFLKTLNKAMGNRNCRSFAKLCGLSYNTLHKYFTEDESTAATRVTRKTLKAVALYAENGITYADLLQVSGYTKEYLEKLGLSTEVFNASGNVNNTKNFPKNKDGYYKKNQEYYPNLNNNYPSNRGGYSNNYNNHNNNFEQRSLKKDKGYINRLQNNNLQNNKIQQLTPVNNDNTNNSNNNISNNECIIKENGIYNIPLDDIKNSYGILNNMSKKTTNLFEKAALETVNHLLENMLGIAR